MCACEGECHGPVQTGGWVAVPIGCCSPTQSVWACFTITRGTSRAGNKYHANKLLQLLGDRLWHPVPRRCALLQRNGRLLVIFVFNVTVFQGAAADEAAEVQRMRLPRPTTRAAAAGIVQIRFHKPGKTLALCHTLTHPPLASPPASQW